MSVLRLAVIALALLAVAPGAAQAQAGAARNTAPAPRRVDPLTASIQGRVTAADSGAPIRRAEIRATGDRGVTRLATTDGDGRFEMRDLPAGEFRLHVSKSGFVPLGYGQRRPFEAPAVIPLGEGQRYVANFALPRGGAIAGRVIDEAGEPLANVRVQALRPRMRDGERRLLPSGPVDVSDDTGAFRVYGLAPGDYYVVGTLPPRMDAPFPMSVPLTPTGPLPAAATVPLVTYHPGTSSFQEAQRVALTAGGEARADIQVGVSRAATVSGVVLASNGAAAGDAMVSLRSAAVSMGVSAVIAGPPPLTVTGHTAADGSFSLPAVPAGPYILQATSQEMTVTPGMPPEMAALPVTVAGSDLAGLTVVTNPQVRFEGLFVADAGVTRPLPTPLGVTASAQHGGPSMTNTGGNGTFRVVGWSGPLHLVVQGLPDDWAVKSILVNGVETIDRPIEARGAQKAEVRIVLTDRVTEVGGRVTDDRPPGNDARRSYDVVVFADDATKWTHPSRFLRTVRTDDGGGFRIAGLPGNERYLAVAVDYLEEGEGGDPEFLERIRDRATPFVLGDAERRAIELRLVRR